jgi:uncharacterized protein YdbL (DUF1318 family)
MKIKPMGAIALTGLALAVLSCITVNIYFPESAVKKTAEEIVTEVRGAEKEKKDEVLQDKVLKGEVLKGAAGGAGGFSLVPRLQAQQETEVTTPRIRAIKESLKARFDRLLPYYDAGRIGEANTGYLEALKEEGLGLQERAGLRKLVGDENKDRRDLYAEVAKALDIDAGQIGRIEKIFAEQWIGQARPGWMIQRPEGAWVKK